MTPSVVADVSDVPDLRPPAELDADERGQQSGLLVLVALPRQGELHVGVAVRIPRLDLVGDRGTGIGELADPRGEPVGDPEPDDLPARVDDLPAAAQVDRAADDQRRALEFAGDALRRQTALRELDPPADVGERLRPILNLRAHSLALDGRGERLRGAPVHRSDRGGHGQVARDRDLLEELLGVRVHDAEQGGRHHEPVALDLDLERILPEPAEAPQGPEDGMVRVDLEPVQPAPRALGGQRDRQVVEHEVLPLLHDVGRVLEREREALQLDGRELGRGRPRLERLAERRRHVERAVGRVPADDEGRVLHRDLLDLELEAREELRPAGRDPHLVDRSVELVRIVRPHQPHVRDLDERRTEREAPERDGSGEDPGERGLHVRLGDLELADEPPVGREQRGDPRQSEQRCDAASHALAILSGDGACR